MAQLNIHVTPEFEEVLDRFIKIRGLRTKSEAIRTAVREGLQRALSSRPTTDFSGWLGFGLTAPLNPEPRFLSDDDLWATDREILHPATTVGIPG